MSVSWLELSWSLVALTGAGMSLWMLLDAYYDYRTILVGIRQGYAKARGARWWIAVGSLGDNGLLLVIWLGFLLVGVIAMQYPPPPRDPAQSSSAASAGWVLIAMEAALAACQFWRRFIRVRVTGKPHVPVKGRNS